MWGGGVIHCGFLSSCHTTEGGLSPNIDMSTSTTMTIQPGPVVDFLIANQNAEDPLSLDWVKAKNLRVKNSATNIEYKITGISDKICKELMCFRFSTKQTGEKDENGEPLVTELCVYEHYVSNLRISLHYSGDLPCIMVGKPKQPTYIPLELCSLVSLEHNHSSSYPVPGSYRLTTLQPAPLVEMSRQKPQDRMKTLRNALKNNNFADEPLLRACGVWVSFTQVEGRILAAPRLTVGNGEEVIPHSGCWNFNNKKLVDPTTITKWAVNFFVHYNFELLISDFIECGNLKGIVSRSFNKGRIGA